MALAAMIQLGKRHENVVIWVRLVTTCVTQTGSKPLTNNAVEEANPNDSSDSPERVPEQNGGVLEHAGGERQYSDMKDM